MQHAPRQTAIIIGAGPAGLTAAYELLLRTHLKPIVFELSPYIGGISKTLNYKGNRIDIGGHRFFSKDDRVMEWWLQFLPLQRHSQNGLRIQYQNQTRTIAANGETIPDPEHDEQVMLIRNRKSRIYFDRKLFDYPISLSFDTVVKLGILRTVHIGLSYLKSLLNPIKPERSLEDFLINRFGRVLYLTFFKAYTEKVWGVDCRQISSEWGAQRIKGLSIGKAIANMIRKMFAKDIDIRQQNTETSLIEMFLYPKYGPGQMWETVAEAVLEKGGQIQRNHKVVGIDVEHNRIRSVSVRNAKTGEIRKQSAEFIFSTMPVKQLIASMGTSVPENVRSVAADLKYRDFITVGILLKKIKLQADDKGRMIADNWIYIQEPDVQVGRLQIFNNWSPAMVSDKNLIWIGTEYFCNQGDHLWNTPDQELIEFASHELEKIEIIDRSDVVDGVVIREPKTYPAYYGAYARFEEIQDYTDRISNLFLIGRNGMHRYNNQDHSMLTAMTAVNNIISGDATKANIWAVNADAEYHEEK